MELRPLDRQGRAETGEIKPSVAAGLFDQFIFSACEHLPEPAAVPTRSPVPMVMAMAPVDWVTPVVAMAPVNGVTPIAIVMPVAMVAPVDGLNHAVRSFCGKQSRRRRSLN